MADTQAKAPVEVFCIYSPRDEDLQERIRAHVIHVLHQGRMDFWHERQVLPGMDWTQEFDEQVNRADLILLLVSVDLLNARYSYGIEMQRALARHAAGEVRVIPILLRAVYWTREPFAKLQFLPRDAKPITSWDKQDEAFDDIAKAILHAVIHIR